MIPKMPKIDFTSEPVGIWFSFSKTNENTSFERGLNIGAFSVVVGPSAGNDLPFELLQSLLMAHPSKYYLSGAPLSSSLLKMRHISLQNEWMNEWMNEYNICEVLT